MAKSLHRLPSPQGFNHLKLIKNTKLVDLSHINIDDSVQSRAGFDEDTLQDYYKAWESGVKFPPVDLYFDGQTYWIGDGFHRIKSRLNAKIRGNKIEAIVHPGNRRDAILHSVGANSTHGLRRTNADKRHAVELLLQDAEWSNWSNCEIARKACVSEFLVRTAREAIFEKIENDQGVRTVERNGKIFTQKTKNIGKSNQFQQSLVEKEIPIPSFTPSAVPARENLAWFQEQCMQLSDSKRTETYIRDGLDELWIKVSKFPETLEISVIKFQLKMLFFQNEMGAAQIEWLENNLARNPWGFAVD